MLIVLISFSLRVFVKCPVAILGSGGRRKSIPGRFAVTRNVVEGRDHEARRWLRGCTHERHATTAATSLRRAVNGSANGVKPLSTRRRNLALEEFNARLVP